MTKLEENPEGWTRCTFTGDGKFPNWPWYAELAAGPPYPDYWVDCPGMQG